MNNTKNILIVDDEPYMMRIVEVTIQNKGFEIRKAQSGREALEAIKEIMPELLILDVVMPEMSGIELLHELKALGIHKRFPIILLTGKGHTLGNENIIEETNVTVMQKPFSPIEMQQAIEWLTSEPSV